VNRDEYTYTDHTSRRFAATRHTQGNGRVPALHSPPSYKPARAVSPPRQASRSLPSRGRSGSPGAAQYKHRDGPVTAAISSPPSWARIAQDATWSPCKRHGKVKLPALRWRRFKGAGKHIEALCPACSRHLGFLSRRRLHQVATVQTERSAYRQFQEQARTDGAKPGQAYFRFRARFGHEPDPEWARML
jgi:hypothetical protein